MQRRTFLRQTATSLAVTGLALSGCTTAVTPTGSDNQAAGQGTQKRREIDAGTDATLDRLAKTVPGSRDLLAKANGVLVFPSVLAAGLAIGGEYGQGALRIGKTPVQYYSLTSVSFGLQIGAQSKAVIFLFMTPEALAKFRASNGWAVGADASVALLKMGANGNIEATGPTSTVLAFVMTNAGLMANLTLEGSKISPLSLT